MTIAEHAYVRTVERRPKGPVTAAVQRRAASIYAVVWTSGLLLTLTANPALQVFGLGLWLPGAGFIATGSMTLFLATLILFGVAIVVWFWAGMVLAPLAVWLAAALIAAAGASEPVTAMSHLTALATMAALALTYGAGDAIREGLNTRKRIARNAFLPASLAEVKQRATVTPPADARELTPENLAALRYVYDRALQPLDQFGGFDIIDQFQPAAIRYQLNHMGYALGVAQCTYLPNFKGYLAEAQNNLIQKYLQRRVWSYWIYESLWGHLDTNFDPAARDNIMLTGWFGMQVGQYMVSSGDRRYAENGSLSFRLNANTTFAHDFHTLMGSIVENYAHYERDFCLYPCEPNWIYPLCNHYGMAALAAHDRLFGTGHVRRIRPVWQRKLDTEFTDSAGSIVGLRSKHLGLEFPFPVWEADLARFANCFAPDLAQRQWAIARKEIEPFLTRDANGQTRLTYQGPGADPGNYRLGHAVRYCAFLIAAREFGDGELADAAQRSLDQDCGLDTTNGIRRYRKASNLLNAQAALGGLMRTGDFRRSLVEGPSAESARGPVLERATYPDVLVAKAVSNGENLHLVLYPGSAGTTQTLTVARLRPGQRYRIDETQAEFIADGIGQAVLTVSLTGRTTITLRSV